MHWTWLLNRTPRNGQPAFEDWIWWAYNIGSSLEDMQ